MSKMGYQSEPKFKRGETVWMLVYAHGDWFTRKGKVRCISPINADAGGSPDYDIEGADTNTLGENHMCATEKEARDEAKYRNDKWLEAKNDE